MDKGYFSLKATQFFYTKYIALLVANVANARRYFEGRAATVGFKYLFTKGYKEQQQNRTKKRQTETPFCITDSHKKAKAAIKKRTAAVKVGEKEARGNLPRTDEDKESTITINSTYHASRLITVWCGGNTGKGAPGVCLQRS